MKSRSHFDRHTKSIMRITKKQTKQAEDFNAAAREMLLAEYSAKLDAHIEHWYIIDTKYGPMMVDPSAMPSGMRGAHADYTVFCRFRDSDNYERASKALPHCNPFSGKYNFHEECLDNEEALNLLRKHLERTQ